jgi:hypothetical protein
MLVVVLDSRGCNLSVLCGFKERLCRILESVVLSIPYLFSMILDL